MTINKLTFQIINICIIFLLLNSCDKGHELSNSGYLNLSFCANNEYIGEDISILTFNRLNKTSISSVSEVFEKLNPDIVGLQESYDVGLQIADRFEYCFYGSKDASISILSKYPIEDINDIYCKIHLNDSLYINFFNVHLPAHPYQPYDIRDTLITTPNQAIHQAEQTRGTQVNVLLELINSIENTMPMILVGDFNEPSHLDWVMGSENAQSFQYNNANQFIVDWPTSNKLLNINFSDVYRELFPDPLLFPGYTWSTVNSVKEVHDRIDFIYYQGKDMINLKSIVIIGPDSSSDVIMDNYQSDHRSVLATFEL